MIPQTMKEMKAMKNSRVYNKILKDLDDLYSKVPNFFKGKVRAVKLLCVKYQAALENEAKDNEERSEWVTTDLDELSIAGRLREVDSWYLNVFGLCISSLGDDTSSFIMISPNHTFEEMTPFYKVVSGWIVEVKKSLASPFNGEYLREQPHNGFVTKVKSFAPLSPFTDGTWVTNIIICKPTATVLRSLFGTENIESKSPLVREIGKLARVLNVNLHPRIDLIIQGLVDNGATEFGLFTKPFDYVPMDCLQAWKAAGKPERSKWHVRIENLSKGLSVAGRDALYLEKINKQPQSKDGDSALVRAIGQSYTKTAMEDYNMSTYLPSTRVARWINAINQGRVSLAQKIVQEVRVIETDYFKKFNNPEEVIEELTTE